MKKLLFSVLTLVLAFSGIPNQGMAAPEYVLSLNLPIPPIHTRWKGPIKAWVDEIEKRSEGRIKIEPYFAEALSPRSEAYESVKSGIADITECAYEANSGQFPFHEGILSIPSPGRFLPDGTSFLEAIYARFPQVQDETKGVKMLFSHASGSLLIGTKSKPVRTLQDLKGLKIQANSALMAERLRALGASIVNMPMTDIYTALEQGVIDGTTLSFELLVSRRWGDQLKYTTALSLQNTLFYMVMNQAVYDGLPDDLKKVIDDVSGDFAKQQFANYWRDVDADAERIWFKDMGGQEFSILSDEDFAEATKLMQPPVDAWFVMLTEKCNLPGDEIKKAYYEEEEKLTMPWKDTLFKKIFDERK